MHYTAGISPPNQLSTNPDSAAFIGHLSSDFIKEFRNIMNGSDRDKQYCFLSGCATNTTLRLRLGCRLGLGLEFVSLNVLVSGSCTLTGFRKKNHTVILGL